MRRLRFLLILLAVAALRADVKLPALISDHMVLQQGGPVRIWGTATPGETVRVSFQAQKVSAVAAASGKWSLFLQPMNAGGPFPMTIAAGNSIVTIEDVLIGDVWVGSGQSNMGFSTRNTINAEQEIAAANYPQIRLFSVKLTESDVPLDDVVGSWKLCSPETVGSFSAVEYFFGRDLYVARKTPMGLIQSAWGGTPAEAWTSRTALESEPALKYYFDNWEKVLADYPAAKEKYDQQLEAWKRASAEAKAQGQKEPRPPGVPRGPGHPHTPSGLYNGMIAPLTAFAINGVVWYQGESNASHSQAFLYERLFSTMIEDWRRAWGEGRFPFLFVQLANFRANIGWPELRDSQLRTLKLRGTGMAVAIDIGNPTDIHPTNKQEVGRRLALAARSIAYGEQILYSGPLFRQATTETGRMRLWFDFIGGGLAARGGGALAGFTIAGADHRFVPADARVDGGTIVVSSPEVKDPEAVRYAWQDNPECNLINKEGLPASPFRSDDWTESTMPPAPSQ